MQAMGTVFGKQSVAEPAFDVILSQNSASVPYEIRRYGTRFAAQVQYSLDEAGNSDGTPFGLLAKYIGVFGKSENEGETSISMTAPVVKSVSEPSKGTPIEMTAPVVKGSSGESNQKRIMQFILPAQYTSIKQIPKPSNPAVTIHTIPGGYGAVFRYNGSFGDDRAAEMAEALAIQLKEDGVSVGDESWILEHYQFWGKCVQRKFSIF